MKKLILVRLSVGLLAAVGCNCSEAESNPTSANERPEATASPATSTAQRAKSNLPARLAEWKLTADDIRYEYEKVGRVERTRPARKDEPMGRMDQTLVAAINLGLKEDEETSSMQFHVSVDNAVVTLSGSAQSLQQIGRAMAIALNLDSVIRVISMMKVPDTVTLSAPGGNAKNNPMVK